MTNYVTDTIDESDKARKRYEGSRGGPNEGKNKADLDVKAAETMRAIHRANAGAGRGFTNPDGVDKGDLPGPAADLFKSRKSAQP